jgi:signal transduction histidine kinase
MIASSLPRTGLPILSTFVRWWHSLGWARRLAGAVSVALICATVYACSLVAQHIQDLFANKAGASTALYMDSFVEPLVQELASQTSLSPENRAALERLLSPASIGKPVVAFRIWVSNRIVFSNRGELIDKTFPPTEERNRAFAGDVIASFGLEGADDEGERALRVPILEIYAPIRQSRTNKIIALAETSELAGDLMLEIRTMQYVSYAILASTAICLILVLVSLTGGLQNQIGELVQQQAEDDQFKKRVCNANRRVLEINERNLRRIGKELYSGPLQLVAFAQLKLDALREAPEKFDAEIRSISDALKKCMTQIRDVSVGLAPADLEVLPLSKVIRLAMCLHEARTKTCVSYEFGDLPHDGPYGLKTCLYQFVEHALGNIYRHTADAKVHVSATREQGMLKIQLVYPVPLSRSWLADEILSGSESLLRRIEAFGGVLSSHADRQVSVVAVSFWLGDGEVTNA